MLDFYSTLSIQIQAIAIHRAGAGDSKVYMNMVIFCNAEFGICPELVSLAVRPVARGVCSEASMAALLP